MPAPAAGLPHSFSAPLQRAIAFCLTAPSGNGAALTSSSHTWRAAVRVAAASPLAALSQIASILARVALDSVGTVLATLLQASTPAAADGVFAEPVVAVELVVLSVVAVPVVALPVELLLVGAVLVVALPVELLLELPQPASSAAAVSEINSQVESVRIVKPPIERTKLRGRPAARRQPLRVKLLAAADFANGCLRLA